MIHRGKREDLRPDVKLPRFLSLLNTQDQGFLRFILAFNPHMIVGIFQSVKRTTQIYRLAVVDSGKKVQLSLHEVHSIRRGIDQRLNLHLRSEKTRMRGQPERPHLLGGRYSFFCSPVCMYSSRFKLLSPNLRCACYVITVPGAIRCHMRFPQRLKLGPFVHTNIQT
jgi:hypothetical protein